MELTGAQIVIKLLERQGITTVAGIPGGSILPIYEKEAEVLRYRFGLNGKESMSLKEVGDVFHLTKERIRQIEKKAIRRLQHPTRMNKLEAYVA